MVRAGCFLLVHMCTTFLVVNEMQRRVGVRGGGLIVLVLDASALLHRSALQNVIYSTFNVITMVTKLC